MEKMNMNGGSLSSLINKWIMGSCALLMTLGTLGTASAGYDATCVDNCHPCLDCDMNPFSLYADFIYWQIAPDATEFARLGGVSETATTPLEDQGRILGIGCDFCPGFRIGGTADLGCCEWDAYAQYTFLIERRTDVTTTEFGESGLVPLIFNLGGGDDVNLAKGDWHSDLNVVDFGLGRSFNVNCCYVFRPHFGFKAAWQDYKYDVTYERILSTTVTGMNRVLRHSRFNGIGLRGGFDADWLFSRCFGISGGMAFSALYTNYCSERTDLRINVDNGVPKVATKNVDLKENYCALIPVMELYLGLKFVKELCDCYSAFVLVGYETQVWYDALQFIQIQNASSMNGDSYNDWTFGNGSITFQGLVLRAGVSY